jgi:hypothetical protein
MTESKVFQIFTEGKWLEVSEAAFSRSTDRKRWRYSDMTKWNEIPERKAVTT